MFKNIDKNNYTYDSYCEMEFKKKRCNFIFKCIFLILLWTPLVVYYFLPISKANIESVKGNALNFDNDYIYEYTSLDKSSHLWNVNTSKIEEELKSHPYCNDAKVTLSFSGIKIELNEVKVVAKTSDESPTYFLSDGSNRPYTTIKDLLKDPLAEESKFIKPYINKIPTINNSEFNNDELNEILENLGNLKTDVLNDIKIINKNNEIKKFVTLTINKDHYSLDKDVLINIDYKDIDILLDEEVIDNVISLTKEKGNKYYNVLVDLDFDKKGVKKGIKIVPYEA